VRVDKLRRGTTRSCGCLHAELNAKRSPWHGAISVMSEDGSVACVTAAERQPASISECEVRQASEHALADGTGPATRRIPPVGSLRVFDYGTVMPRESVGGSSPRTPAEYCRWLDSLQKQSSGLAVEPGSYNPFHDLDSR
jgi:hypothetical protein